MAHVGTTRSIVKAVAAVGFLAIVLAGCQTGSSATTTSSTFLTTFAAEQLPDGTAVEIRGFVVAADGRTLFTNVLNDSFPPGYSTVLDLYGVEVGPLDLFKYPLSDILWSDKYLITGSIRDGDLYADSIQFLGPNNSRQKIEDCEAAVDHPEDLGTCPEWMFEYYSDNPGG
jgi:hypothetical protein